MCLSALAELHSPTGFVPKDLTEEDTSMLVTPMSFHRPSRTSTYHPAESIGTPPPNSDLGEEQVRDMLASPLYLQEREGSADRSRVCRSFRGNSVSGKTAAVFSHKGLSSQETLSDRKGVSSGHQPVQGKDETFFRFSDPEDAARLVFEEQRDHLLAEAKSEILNHECKDDLLNTSIREFGRQAHSNRLEMDYMCMKNLGEQARLRKDLA